MDTRFSEEQEIMRQSSRDFLTSRCPKSLVKEIVNGDKEFPQQIWQEMADLGWMGLIFPPEYDGTDGSFMDLVVLLEEMGRACLPGPFFTTVVLGGLCLVEAGNLKQKQELLTRIVRGDIKITLAITEIENDYNPSSMTVTAKAGKDGYILNGTKMFVPEAQASDYIICAARTQKGSDSEDGITLFIVDSRSPGININKLKATSTNKEYEVIFDKVKVPKENILGEESKGWQYLNKVLHKAAAAKCAEMVGGAQQVLDMTVAYAKERVQFKKLIGSFQAVQHHCANMLVDVHGCRWVTYKTAWMIDAGMDYEEQTAIAKAWCNEAYRRVVILGHQVIGGVGYIMDHDLPLYFKHARVAELEYGDTDYHRNTVAEKLYVRY